MACCRRQTASRRPRFRAGQPTPGRGSLMSVPVDVGACRGAAGRGTGRSSLSPAAEHGRSRPGKPCFAPARFPSRPSGLARQRPRVTALPAAPGTQPQLPRNSRASRRRDSRPRFRTNVFAQRGWLLCLPGTVLTHPSGVAAPRGLYDNLPCVLLRVCTRF